MKPFILVGLFTGLLTVSSPALRGQNRIPAHPALAFSSFLGGNGGGYDSEQAMSVAVGTDGNCYVAGNTSSTNFPVTQWLGPQARLALL